MTSRTGEFLNSMDTEKEEIFFLVIYRKLENTDEGKIIFKR